MSFKKFSAAQSPSTPDENKSDGKPTDAPKPGQPAVDTDKATDKIGPPTKT